MRFHSVIVALVLVTGLCGCQDHTRDVVGVWDWGTYAVHFDADHTWGATDKQRPTYEKMAGEWAISGDKLTLRYSGSGSPGPDGSVFVVGPDGASMEAETGAMGTMKKRLASAGMDVK